MRLRLLLLVGTLLTLFACLPESPGLPEGEISLDQSVFDPTVSYYIFRRGIGLDSFPQDTTLLKIPRIGRVKVQVASKDIILNRKDSVRISLIHCLDPIYDYALDDFNRPDYLLLSPYGLDTLPIALDQSNAGMICSRTYFRVARKDYRLAALDSTRSLIEIEPVDGKINIEPVAQYDPGYKRITVKTLKGKDATIGRTPGRDLLVFFWSLGSFDHGQQLVALDSLLRNNKGVPLDVATINMIDSKANIQDFAATHGIQLPIYKTTPTTCSGIMCHPSLPYGMLINGNGRIVTHYISVAELQAYLGAPELTAAKLQDLR